jgi:hypothetical protein
MPTSTAKWALPYPVPADPADVPTDMGALAARIEAVGPYAWAATNGSLAVPGGLTAGSTIWDQTTNAHGFIYNPTNAPASYMGFGINRQGEAQPRWQVLDAGQIWWGAGGATAPDTNLYRAAGGILRTDGRIDTNLSATTSIAIASIISGGARWFILADGKQWWSGDGVSNDTNLYRAAAGVLKTDGRFDVLSPAGAATDLALFGGYGGNGYWYIQRDGKYIWGTAGGSYDTNLYRSAVGVLKTDNNLRTEGYVSCGGDMYLDSANTGKKVYWGSAADTALYRSSAQVLSVTNQLNAGTEVYARAGGGSSQQVFIGYSASTGLGGLYMGATDTGLYRNGVCVLALWWGVWGTFQAAGFAVQSDRKTKSDAEPAGPLHEKLLSAKVYTYKRDESDKRHLGLMADELPDEVVERAPHLAEKIDEMEFVDLYKLSAALLSTVQHLNERITALEGA